MRTLGLSPRIGYQIEPVYGVGNVVTDFFKGINVGITGQKDDKLTSGSASAGQTIGSLGGQILPGLIDKYVYGKKEPKAGQVVEKKGVKYVTSNTGQLVQVQQPQSKDKSNMTPILLGAAAIGAVLLLK